MIISTDKIASKCQVKDNAVIWPFDINDNKGNPAKVELHLGAKCYCSSDPNIIVELKDGSKTSIAPNSIFLFQTLEKVNLPKNLSGRMGLKMSLVAKGLLMSNQTQVDPGYNNYLFGMIYNLSDQEIELEYGKPITTLEFFQTEESQDTFYAYNGSMQNCLFESFVKNRIHSSLGSLESEVRSLKSEIEKDHKKWDGLMTILAILLAACTIISSATGCYAALKENAEVALLKENVNKLQEIVQEDKEVLSSQAKQLESYEQIITDLENKLNAPTSATNLTPEP